jgi:hypothetical protein
MDIDKVLQTIQDIRSQLEVLGVTNQGLWFVGGAAALLFVLSLREVIAWYFKVNQVRDEVRELRSQMIVMHRMLKETRDMVVYPNNLPSVPPLKPEELVKIAQGTRDALKFRLDH